MSHEHLSCSASPSLTAASASQVQSWCLEEGVNAEIVTPSGTLLVQGAELKDSMNAFRSGPCLRALRTGEVA